MRYFRNIDLDWLSSARLAVADELSRHDDAWLANQTRQQRVKVQRHPQSIWLRSADKDKEPGKIVDDVHASHPSKMSAFFPTTMKLLDRFASDLSGELGRAIVVRLAPNSVVYPHIDHGEYYKPRDRYHFVIDSPTGSPLKSGDEDVTMQQGGSCGGSTTRPSTTARTFQTLGECTSSSILNRSRLAVEVPVYDRSAELIL